MEYKNDRKLKKAVIIEEKSFECEIKDKVSLLEESRARNCALYQDNLCFSPSSDDSYRSRTPSFYSSTYFYTVLKKKKEKKRKKSLRPGTGAHIVTPDNKECSVLP